MLRNYGKQDSCDSVFALCLTSWGGGRERSQGRNMKRPNPEELCYVKLGGEDGAPGRQRLRDHRKPRKAFSHEGLDRELFKKNGRCF